MTLPKKSAATEPAGVADQTLETVVDRLESMVSERPLVAIGMAAGVGVLLGFLWRR
jgi:ElaB/YqjD/DUF883 family membrane-anchored ribosome-binding protein